MIMFDGRAGMTCGVFCSSFAIRADKKAVIRLKHAIRALAVPVFGLHVGAASGVAADWL
jgi:hypothetical protein